MRAGIGKTPGSFKCLNWTENSIIEFVINGCFLLVINQRELKNSNNASLLGDLIFIVRCLLRSRNGKYKSWFVTN